MIEDTDYQVGLQFTEEEFHDFCASLRKSRVFSIVKNTIERSEIFFDTENPKKGFFKFLMLLFGKARVDDKLLGWSDNITATRAAADVALGVIRIGTNDDFVTLCDKVWGAGFAGKLFSNYFRAAKQN